jgi:hypothetical protein
MDIQQAQFKKKLEQIVPLLSLLHNEGISLEETKEELLKSFIETQKDNPDLGLAERMNPVCNSFRKWLLDEKKLSEDRVTELSRPLYLLLMNIMGENLEKLENKEMGEKAKIINFPEKLK